MHILIWQGRVENSGTAFEKWKPQLMTSPRGNQRISALKNKSKCQICQNVSKCQIIYVLNPLMTVKSVGSRVAEKKELKIQIQKY